MTTTCFASIRIVTDDIQTLTGFYETLIGATAFWGGPQFAEIRTSAGRIALAGTATLAVYGGSDVRPAANNSVIFEFLVADVDAEFARLTRELDLDLVQEPTTMPWGNRSMLLRDLDGNLVNLFTPVSPEAVARFS